MTLGNRFVAALSESPFAGSLFRQDDTSGHFYFQSLGSGSSGNCSLLIYNEQALILDAGIGIRSFHARGTTLLNSPIKPMGMLITHDHGDHIRGAARIAQLLEVPIYSTPEVCRVLRHRSLASKYDVTAYLREIQVDAPFRIGHFAIRAFDVPHDATRNVGYSISAEPGTFSLITDVGNVTQEIRKAIRRSNFLVFESNYDEQMLQEGRYTLLLKERIKGGDGHLSNAIAGQTLVEELHPGLKFIALCHLSGNNNTPELALRSFSDCLVKGGIDALGLIRPDLGESGIENENERPDRLCYTAIERNKVSPIFRLG